MSISLGLFYVNTATIRKFISERHLQIAQLILKVIAKRVRSRGDSLIAKFIEASRNVSFLVVTPPDILIAPSKLFGTWHDSTWLSSCCTAARTVNTDYRDRRATRRVHRAAARGDGGESERLIADDERPARSRGVRVRLEHRPRKNSTQTFHRVFLGRVAAEASLAFTLRHMNSQILDAG